MRHASVETVTWKVSVNNQRQKIYMANTYHSARKPHFIFPFVIIGIVGDIRGIDELLRIGRVHTDARFASEYRYKEEDQRNQVDNRHWHQKTDMLRQHEPTDCLVGQCSVHCAITRGGPAGVR